MAAVETKGTAMKPKTWKRQLAPPDHDHFVCHGCGAEVYRPNRPFDDDWKCLNCWYGKPNQEEIEAIARRVVALHDKAERIGWFTSEMADEYELLLIPLSQEDFDAVQACADHIFDRRRGQLH